MTTSSRLCASRGIVVALCWFVAALRAGEPSLTVDLSQPGPAIHRAMWGVFFEDINFGGDGGLHAERIKNRSFEFPQPLLGWRVLGGTTSAVSVATVDPLHPRNPHYLRMRLSQGRSAQGIANEGFRGIGVRQGERYEFSVQARVAGGTPRLRVELVSSAGAPLAQAELRGFKGSWRRHGVTLTPSATDLRAQLLAVAEGQGTLDLDMVSLYPEQTWKRRARGQRADLVQWLADLKPGFVRFPGGCIVEGRHLPLRYQWKETIGPAEERPTLINRWNDEFKHRPTPDYFQSFGVGFFEFFQICEDMGAEPLPILNCGMACQFNSAELVPLAQLDPFIQDALDLIEFANGPASSPWGGRRAAMGHAKPFGLKMLGIGNEQWGPPYLERYERFAQVLKARHPEIQLIGSAGPDPDGEKFEFLWPRLRELKADLVDEHYYRPPAWFLDHTTRYDGYPRTGPKVFAGEYAAQSVRTVSPDNRNNWGCALAEAAFLTGLERNAEVVRLASYAPLLAHVDAWQWTPNLIWFDNLGSYGTPNYYVQQLFSRNRGDHVVPLRLADAPTAANGQPRLYASAVRDRRSGEVILKVVNATPAPRPVGVRIEGPGTVKSEGRMTVLSSPRLEDENSLERPRNVAPRERVLSTAGRQFRQTFEPYSLTVLRLRVKP